MLDEKYEKGIVSHREQGVRISAQARVDASVGAGEHCSGVNDERGENQMPGAKKEVDGQPLAHCAQNEVFTRPLPQDSGGKGRAAKLRREKALIEAMQAAPNLSIDLMSQDFPLPIVGAHALPTAPKQACALEDRDGGGASPAGHLRREDKSSNICQATLSSDPCSRNLNAGEDSGKSDAIVACTSADLNPHAASGAHQRVHVGCSSTSSAGVNGHANANATQRNSTAVCEQQAAAVSDDTQALAAHDATATGNETVRNFLFFFCFPGTHVQILTSLSATFSCPGKPHTRRAACAPAQQNLRATKNLGFCLPSSRRRKRKRALGCHSQTEHASCLGSVRHIMYVYGV